MSLFPAYRSNSGTDTPVVEENAGFSGVPLKENTHKTQELSWLNNPSFPSEDFHKKHENHKKKERKQTHEEKSETSCAEIAKHTNHSSSRHKKKDKKDKTKLSRQNKTTTAIPKILESDQFYEDKKQERGNFLVDRLYRPAVPRYNKNNPYIRKHRCMMKIWKKDKIIKRYFNPSCSKKGDQAVEYNDDPSTREESLTKMTEEFNKKLAAKPGDVDVWLDYINFQDIVYEFEKAYRKNPIGGERVTTERKLAIIERALKSNPASERLLAERLELSERVKPVDQLAEECRQALIQDPGNLSIWRILVRTTRNNMARCTVPGVLQVFSKAITRVSQLRLHRLPVAVERDILSLFVESGLFLQQAGLWEQLWTLLQMYLGLGLTISGQFTVSVPIEEDKLREEEDSVIASGLPLSVLWLRVEKLRAASHFLPDLQCDSDPQRVVFSDDLSGLLQPVMSAELRLQVVVSAVVLLKVPLLPTRHSLLRCLGLLDIPSATNNIETLLAALYPTGISIPTDCTYLSGVVDLISEPQFFRDQGGQQQYLSFVVSVLQHCAALVSAADVLHTWTLRLYGLLCRLHSLGLGVPASVVKQAKSHAKQLLKQPQFRDNLLLYTEYALIERDAGDLNKACKVLETAAAMPLSGEPDVNYVMLCRRLVECLLLNNPVTDKERAVRVLVCLGEQKPLAAEVVSDVTIKRSTVKWQQKTLQLVDQYSLQATEPLTVLAAMTPHILVEWLTCHSLLLYLTCSVWEATALLQHHIDLIPYSPNTLGSVWVEELYEVLVDTLHLHSLRTRTSFAVLRNTLVKALSCFPNNLSLLHTLASVETGSGGGGTPMWKLVGSFPSSADLARIVLVFVVRFRVSSNAAGGVTSTSGTNYLKNLVLRLTEERTTGQCPLLWRLYLQLVAANDSPAQVKASFYKCLQVCPWVKAFYVDAIKFLPEEMGEIQDLLIEKELRLHTTPEELEILRD